MKKILNLLGESHVWVFLKIHIFVGYISLFTFFLYQSDKETLKNIFAPLFTGGTTALVAYLIFKFGTNYLEQQRAVNDFHKKYIEMRNELSAAIIDLFSRRYLDPNINDLKLIFKFLNLLFEETLSSKTNYLIKSKLPEWIKSTLLDIDIFLMLFNKLDSQQQFFLTNTYLEYEVVTLTHLGFKTEKYKCIIKQYVESGLTIFINEKGESIEQIQEVDSTHLFSIELALIKILQLNYNIKNQDRLAS